MVNSGCRLCRRRCSRENFPRNSTSRCFQNGFIRRSTVEINLEKVEALRVEQSFMGRILNYGTIFISGAGTSVAPMKDIADPLVFRRKFMEATNRPITMPRGGMG